MTGTTQQALRVFVGYDCRERDAYEVCVRSLLKHSTHPLSIQPLDETRLRHAHLYRRGWHYENGQSIDNLDGKPFSTSFSFTRFLVPALCQWNGLALYCDCDFLWRSDVSFLFRDVDASKAVSVVKHVHNPDDKIKMEGQVQTRYYRKNWSSLILYNCSHSSNFMLTPHAVHEETGQWLHGFSWLQDHEIGDIDISWNCLSGVNTDEVNEPLAVHFTKGTPSMPGHENDPYADEWRESLRSQR